MMMGEKLKRLEAYAELQADGFLEKVIAWRRTAVIIALVLMVTHAAAFIIGVMVGR